MGHFITFLFIMLGSCSFLAAQPTWRVYLGDNMDSLYNIEYCTIDKVNNLSYFRFYGFDRFSHHSEVASFNHKENRMGLVLTAKNTRQHIANEEIIFGNNDDSVKVIFKSRTDIVTHGRSAALSILNLFSKSEDKVEQDEPYDEVTYNVMSGVIIHGNDTSSFFCSKGAKSKNSDIWLTIAADTLRLTPAKLFRKAKNGAIKSRSNRNEGWQLMKGETCLAALDKNEQPMALYLRKEIIEKTRLVIAAFFVIRSLEKFL